MATHSSILPGDLWTEEPGHGVARKSDLAQEHTNNNHTPAYCFKFTLSIYKEEILHQIRSVAQSCPTLCDPMNPSTPGLPVHHQLPEFTQPHVRR